MTTLSEPTGRVLPGSGNRRWRLLPTPDLEGFVDAGPGLPDLMRTLLALRVVHTSA